MAACVTTLESTVESLAPETKAIETRRGEVEVQTRRLTARLDDQEGKARRNNIRITGASEGVQGDNTLQFIEDWLQDVVAPDGLTKFYALERAHRVPARPPKHGGTSRPIVAKLLHY